MSEVRLVIRDEHEDRSGIVHGSTADLFVAALSADPVSIAELDTAMDRFALESPVRGHLQHFSHGLNSAPWDAGIVVIDLAARMVVIESSYSSPGRIGVVTRHNLVDAQGASVELRYRLSDEWIFLQDSRNWEAAARMRRQQRADHPPIDLREIFYGEPMLRAIIAGCLKQFSRRDEIAQQVRVEWIERRRHWNERYANEPQPEPERLTMHELAEVEEPNADIEHRIYYDTIRDIHANWLMTPCKELDGQLPRAVMLRDHKRLRGDMSDREDQWYAMERCPPGISPESHAFQFSGFNTNEIVMYYDYVREVAWSCWDRLRCMSNDELTALTSSPTAAEEFTCREAVRLRDVGEHWLDSPWDEDPRRTPRGIINLERRRQPNGGQFHPIDPDCPCCQALAAMPGIGFWHMDGCNMDDLFAFAYHHDTVESWEKEQEEHRELSEQMDQEWKLARDWNLPPQFSDPPAEFGNVWRLVVKMAAGDIPLGQRLVKAGHQLVSVIVQLRNANQHDPGFAMEHHIMPLQSQFSDLQDACKVSTTQDLSPDVEQSAERLLDSVDELIVAVNHFVGYEDAEDDNHESDFNGTELSFIARISPLPPEKFRWGKVIHRAKELRLLLQSFTDIAEQKSFEGWDFGDAPF